MNKIFYLIKNFLVFSLFISFPIVFFFTSSFLFAKTPFYISEIDIASYPEISIRLKNKIGTNIDKEKTIIQEKYKQNLRFSQLDSLQRSKSKKGVKFVFLVEASNDQLNKKNKKLIENIVYNINDNDKIQLIFLLDGNFISYNNLNKEQIHFRLDIPVVSTRNNLSFSLEQAFQELGNNIESNSFILLLLLDNKNIKVSSDLSYFLTRIQNQVHIFSPFSPFTVDFLKYSGGNFYDSNQTTYRDILREYHHFKDQEILIKYKSHLKSLLNFNQKNVVQITFEYGDKQLESNYTVSNFLIVKNTFLEPYVFYSTMFFSFFFVLYIKIKTVRKKRYSQIDQEEVENSLQDKKEIIEEKKESIDTTSEVSFDDSKLYSLINNGRLQEAEIYTKAFLIQQELDLKQKQYLLDKDEIYIGRTRTNDLILEDTSVSSCHSKIKKFQNRYILFDMVTNATFINGKKLLKPEILRNFDEINIGKYLFIFRGE